MHRYRIWSSVRRLKVGMKHFCMRPSDKSSVEVQINARIVG